MAPRTALRSGLGWAGASGTVADSFTVSARGGRPRGAVAGCLDLVGELRQLILLGLPDGQQPLFPGSSASYSSRVSISSASCS